MLLLTNSRPGILKKTKDLAIYVYDGACVTGKIYVIFEENSGIPFCRSHLRHLTFALEGLGKVITLILISKLFLHELN